MAKGIPGLPRTEISTTDAYFTRVTEDFQQRAKTSRVPKWVGELYLEFHRGTYTSIAKNKRNNRKSEFLYQKAETLSVLSNLFCQTLYPKDSLYYKDKMWPVDQVKSVETVDGCARRGIKVVKTYGASEITQPLMAVLLSGNGAGLPETFSLVRCDQPNVILETVKQAEDGRDLILRFYEAYDRRVRARLTLGIPFASVEVCDLMENPVSDAEISVSGREITLPVRNFEIVTLRIHQ